MGNTRGRVFATIVYPDSETTPKKGGLIFYEKRVFRRLFHRFMIKTLR
jgi:hypothetical protein